MIQHHRCDGGDECRPSQICVWTDFIGYASAGGTAVALGGFAGGFVRQNTFSLFRTFCGIFVDRRTRTKTCGCCTATLE